MAINYDPQMLAAFGFAPGEPIRMVEYLHVDGTIVKDRWLGLGSSGLVVEQGPYAVKLPVLSREVEADEEGVPLKVYSLTPKRNDYDDRAIAVLHIQVEKTAHRRLGSHSGIVRCYDLESPEPLIRMDRMPIDLQRWLQKHRPTRQMQLCWFTKLAHTLAYIHDRRVLVTDIRQDNFLLDEALDIRFCDSGNATTMPLEWDQEGTDEHDYSTSIDVGQLGAVMYEVITGQKCEFDLVWVDCGIPCPPPRREDLPATQDVWLGDIIENCWIPTYKSAKELAAALDRAAEHFKLETGTDSAIETQEQSSNGDYSPKPVCVLPIPSQPEIVQGLDNLPTLAT